MNHKSLDLQRYMLSS